VVVVGVVAVAVVVAAVHLMPPEVSNSLTDDWLHNEPATHTASSINISNSFGS
jgi:hypothetical protein